MKNPMSYWFRNLRPLVLAGCLVISPVGPVSVSVYAQAQAPAAEGEEEEKSEGRSLDGYLLMVMLAAMAFFVVGKTARR